MKYPSERHSSSSRLQRSNVKKFVIFSLLWDTSQESVSTKSAFVPNPHDDFVMHQRKSDWELHLCIKNGLLSVFDNMSCKKLTNTSNRDESMRICENWLVLLKEKLKYYFTDRKYY